MKEEINITNIPSEIISSENESGSLIMIIIIVIASLVMNLLSMILLMKMLDI